MPPLWMRFVIVLFWLGSTGWFAYQDLWPRLRSAQPPPYTIDLVDEVQQRRPDIYWHVYQNEQQVFRARTRIKRLDTDCFELEAEYTQFAKSPGGRFGPATIRKLHSIYRVDALGNLLGLEVDLETQVEVAPNLQPTIQARIEGEVKQGRLATTIKVSGGGKELALPLPTIDVARGGSVLLPLHPVNRIRGLQPGQRWQMSLMDPFEESFRSFQALENIDRTLDVYVLEDLHPLPLPPGVRIPRRPVDCLVIVYNGAQISAKTWVEEKTGRVLRQETTLKDQRWVIHRD